MHTITSLCYIPRAKVVWIASASHKATLYDPKAGENVCAPEYDVVDINI